MSPRRRFLLLLGLVAGTAHAQYSAISRNPAVVAVVEDACIDRSAPAWEEEGAFASMWARGRDLARVGLAAADECSVWRPPEAGQRRSLRDPSDGPADPARARRCLARWEATGSLLHELGPASEPAGEAPLLSRRYPSWAPYFLVPTDIPESPRDPGAPAVLTTLLHWQGENLLEAGRGREALETFRLAHRVGRVLARGARTNQDPAFVAVGTLNAHHLQGLSWRLSLRPGLAAPVRQVLRELVDQAPRRLVSWRAAVRRDLAFRRCAVDLVDGRLGGLAPVLLGDGRAQLDQVEAYLLRDEGPRPELAGAHPVLADFLSLRGLERVRKARRRFWRGIAELDAVVATRPRTP